MSAFCHHVQDYLRLTRSFGYNLDEAARLLPRFAAYLKAAGAEFVTIDLALAWALEPAVPPVSVVPSMRLLVVRGFARYMAGVDPRTEIPPTGLIPFRRRRRPPFIYRTADITALMTQARWSLREPLRAATYETLIGLLAVTGLRVGEAIKLDRGDVNWTDGVLLVRQSKFNKSRYVPVLDSTLHSLRRYARRRDELCPTPRDESLFVLLRGTRLYPCTVETTFRRLCDAAGVGAGAALPPRLHDLRHTFAVTALLGWYPAAARQPAYDRLLPRHAEAAAALRARHDGNGALVARLGRPRRARDRGLPRPSRA